MIIHVIGLILAAGSSSIKLLLLLKCKSDRKFYSTYFQVTPPITKFIITGMILTTLSGIAWIIIGYTFEPLLIFKMALVGLIWILGPIIDNVAEPKLKKIISVPEQITSPSFINIQQQYLVLEVSATTLMYAITIIGLYL
jgi:hypothetical protein